MFKCLVQCGGTLKILVVYKVRTILNKVSTCLLGVNIGINI